MKIVTVVGARPQFIKAAVVSRALQGTLGIKEVLLHTGQHFDANMSEVFFDQLAIPVPNYRLDIHGGSHGAMTGRMLTEVEQVLLAEKPDRVLVYGDTNSTLAGALAAAKLHIPVAHVEAGLRSFNMRMPEEINRMLTDQLSDLLFCPTSAAVSNLKAEGFNSRKAFVQNVGDVMQDSALLFAARAVRPDKVEQLVPFVLATLHRAENTDNPERLTAIINALNVIHREIAPVVLPLHPRTEAAIKSCESSLEVCAIQPVSYFEMLWLLKHCGLVLTDSGGVQKEAFFFRKFCITMRDETEWQELVDHGVNTLVGASVEKIISAVNVHFGQVVEDNPSIYGGGQASSRIAAIIANSDK